MGDSIIISSGKGGVGKTSMVVNLGAALCKLGKSVAIVDGSLTTPDVSLHLGIPLHVRGLSHILKENSPLEAASFNHSSGVRVIPGNVHSDLLNEFEGKKFASLLSKLKKEHDFVLVDCAAGLGREALSAIQNCDKMIIVVNPELASVVNSSKAIQLARNLKTKPIGVIVNRRGRYKKELKEKDIEPLMHRVPIIGRIPEDKKISISTKNSQPVVTHYPRSRTTRKIKKIALSLSPKQKKRFLRNFLEGFKKYKK